MIYFAVDYFYQIAHLSLINLYCMILRRLTKIGAVPKSCTPTGDFMKKVPTASCALRGR